MSSAAAAFSVIASDWHRMKLVIEHAAGFSHDAIHVLIGGAGPLFVAFATRRTIASWLPWLVLFVLILFNETVDLWVEHWPDRMMQYGDGAKDIFLTMALPTLLLITARATPRIYSRSRR
jgi:hypothetical protein